MTSSTKICVASVVGVLTLALVGAPAEAQSPGKRKIVAEVDLPRFTYPAPASAVAFVKVDDATFKPFLDAFARQLDGILFGYDIQDKATLRNLLADKEAVEILRGNSDGVATTIDQERPLQEKPTAKAMFHLYRDPLLTAWRETGSQSGPAYQASYAKAFIAILQTLDWVVVQEELKSTRADCSITSPVRMEGMLKRLDEDTKKSGTLDLDQAALLIFTRFYFKYYRPVEAQACTAISSYIRSHSVAKPDIWAKRDVDLTADDKLHPVNVAIWDSGVDTGVYANQMYTDPQPGTHGPHGLAFDVQGVPFIADLQPLTAEQKAFYPRFLELTQGFNDLHDGIDSPAATAAQQFFKSTSPDKLAHLSNINTFLGQWTHGTHVAGIAIQGNPAARLVVIQFNDGLAYLPFPPTVEWANRFKADFEQVGDYLREHDVRVVNMSWLDSVSEFEEWLGKASEQDPDKRKRVAEDIYAIWKAAVQGAIERAPNTLFFCAAGNTDSDANFNGDVPASLQLPNLVTVGAVDQAGEETSFTSYGKTVVLDANGYRVLSYLPGGTQARYSGTSMASPNAANLAAKLIAIEPTLTPAQVIAIMETTADSTADGRLHLINPKAALAKLKGGTLSHTR